MRISPRPRTAVLVFLGYLPNAILALVLVLSSFAGRKVSAFRRSASPFPTHSPPLDGHCPGCSGSLSLSALASRLVGVTGPEPCGLVGDGSSLGVGRRCG